MTDSTRLANVKPDVRNQVGSDRLAADLANALSGLFEINSYKKFRAFNGNYVSMYAKPTKTVSGSLDIEREVFLLIANYSSLHARTLSVCQQTIAAEQPRLQPNLVVILHADPEGDEHLRAWGRELGLTVLPIFRPSGGAMPPAGVVRQRLARELFATDSFQVTGPVSEDNDFFGRREQAVDLVRQLQAGRISAIFGLRKVGKTSMINRVIDLAKKSGSPRVAMVDCSIRRFNEMNSQEALKALARVSRLAVQQGYAHISQTLHRADNDLMTTFESLWSTRSGSSLLIILDEIDYITPDSPTSPHWQIEFNEFWREFRALVQEAKRHDFNLSLLVSGVSSQRFRVAEIQGVENSVLHFVPEDYLSPFEPGAADAMLKALSRRCGLQLTSEGRAIVSSTAAYMPYWIRMVGSYVHRHVGIDGRPVELDTDVLRELCYEFAATEGAEIARVALQNLRRVDKPMFEVLLECARSGSYPLGQARPLLRYGLVRQRGNEIIVDSDMVRKGLLLLEQADEASTDISGRAVHRRSLDLDESEWAEELASIGRRRNLLERKAREFIRVVLKMSLPADRPWTAAVTAALDARRREECAGLTPDALMSKLYWIELSSIISREWSIFQRFFQDKRRLQTAFQLLNERPDAHAKDIDLADVALQRKELTWLEERIAQ
ncbi:ATP-binding protein [Micromonospora tulbaghiae]|uniref:hypothetical protein n=1 Tax=Micromonospora tulbaghiae TaxID=479978 RepID=UPI00370FE3CB